MLIAAVVLSTITIGIILLFARSVNQARDLSLFHHKRLLAEAYVTELLEFFHSLTNDQINQHLKRNPFSLSTLSADLYPLCAHINILDRTKVPPVLLNPDPLATLGPVFIVPYPMLLPLPLS